MMNNMKTLITICSLMLLVSIAQAQDTITDFSGRKLIEVTKAKFYGYSKTKYKPGFDYYNSVGQKVTLIKYLNNGRWSAIFEQLNLTMEGTVPESSINIDTQRWVLNAINGKYYEYVIPPAEDEMFNTVNY